MNEPSTILQNLIDYIRVYSIGDIIYRRSLLGYNVYRGAATVDCYRNYLTQAGYLQKSGRGEYMYIKKIPKNLKLKRLLREAYPKRKF